MNLVIDESEDISLDLLSSLFASIRKENQNVSPISWKLGEQIITRINAQLEKIMAPTQKLPSKLLGAHDVKVEVVECASNQPSIVLKDLDLKQVLLVNILLLQCFKTRGRVFSNQRRMMRETQEDYYLVLFMFASQLYFLCFRS